MARRKKLRNRCVVPRETRFFGRYRRFYPVNGYEFTQHRSERSTFMGSPPWQLAVLVEPTQSSRASAAAGPKHEITQKHEGESLPSPGALHPVRHSPTGTPLHVDRAHCHGKKKCSVTANGQSLVVCSAKAWILAEDIWCTDIVGTKRRPESGCVR